MRYSKAFGFVVLFVIGSVVYIGCRRVDHTNSTLQLDPTERFFRLPAGTNPLVSAISQKMQRQNSTNPFVAEFVKWAGFPVWEKAVTPSKENNTIATRGNGGGGNEEVVYIPVVKDNQSKTSALVIAVLNDRGDTTLWTLYHTQYKDYPYRTSNTQITRAETVALLFMSFDKYLFEHEWFAIDDPLLFQQPALSTEPLRGVHITNNISTTSITICWDVEEGSGNCPPTPPTTPTPPPPSCNNPSVKMDCVYIWQGGGGGGGSGTPPPPAPPSGGGGGPYGGWPLGGGSGGPGNPYNPSFCNSLPPGQTCGGPSGWTPVVPPVVDEPCDPFMTTLKNDSTFKSNFSSLNTSAVLNLNYEKGFYVANRASNNYVALQGDPNEAAISLSGITLPTDGILHSHYAGLNSIFSPGDVVFMAQLFMAGLARDSNNLFYGVTSSYGNPYLIKITNAANFRKFAEKITKSAKAQNDFEIKYASRFNSDNPTKNEKGFLNMMADERVGNGFSLFRGNPTCTQWKKLTRNASGGDPVETICN